MYNILHFYDKHPFLGYLTNTFHTIPALPMKIKNGLGLAMAAFISKLNHQLSSILDR